MDIQAKNTQRLLSLDIFRGITIALMILVNSQGNEAYRLISHSEWNGCTLADLVFPFFVFILGVSLVFSLSKSLTKGISLNTLIAKIIKRTIIIFLMGLFINAFPFHFHFATIRVFGVLQRIAICYFFASILFLTTRLQTQALIMLILLIGYWLIMTLLPIPHYGADNLSQIGNAAAYFDREVFSSAHLYGKFYDPEGILSTLPAIATTLLGNLIGAWIISERSQVTKIKGIALLGVITLIIGWIWGLFFPINKALWTSSYALYTGGLALLLFAGCYWLIEIKGWKKWAKPFEIFGINAIAVYFLHVFFIKVLAAIHIQNADGTTENLRMVITKYLFGWTTLANGELLFGICYVILWLLILTILYRNKIFIKI